MFVYIPGNENYVHINCTLRSEGPAQVFLIVLNWMIAALGHLDKEAEKASHLVI